jgi:hypothetical protein
MFVSMYSGLAKMAGPSTAPPARMEEFPAEEDMPLRYLVFILARVLQLKSYQLNRTDSVNPRTERLSRESVQRCM